MKLFGRVVSPGLSELAKSAEDLLNAASDHDRAAAINFIHDCPASVGNGESVLPLS